VTGAIGIVRLMAAVAVAAAAVQGATTASVHRHEAVRVSMGCTYSIVAYGETAAALPGAVEAALDEVDRIDRLMSHYKTESALSRLNREAARGPVRVDAELFDFIAESLRYSRESDGAFDITVGPLMKAWGFFRGEGRVPPDAELAVVRERVGYRHVVLDQARRTIAFDTDGVELDLGGIAKGYAVDRAAAVLKAASVPAALVSAGGSTTLGIGAPPGLRGWSVDVQDPIDARKVALTVNLRDRALSISGSYGKSFEEGGVTYSHIMDPRTARPVQGMLSVAVLTDTGMAGDALDDLFFVAGAEASQAHVNRLHTTEAYFFLPSATSWTLKKAAPGSLTTVR
jgi:thiamine biosynthesis lipoprotein